MKTLLTVIGVLFLIIVIFGVVGDKQQTNNKTITTTSSSYKDYKPSSSSQSKKARLKSIMVYLNDIKEIQWWEVDNNTIYISFNPVPSDWTLIIKGAALKGNNEIDFGVHVWALNNKSRGWRPGDSGYLGEVTARYGKIK